jgi:hypothetical protein
MKSDEYRYLEDTLQGRRARDPEFEAKLSDVADSRAIERQRQLDSLTPEEREIEQRRYSLSVYGKEHMKRYASPIISDKPLGELQIPGDQIVGSAPSAPLKVHSEGERPGPWQDKNGRLILQNHAACPQNQVLKIRA